MQAAEYSYPELYAGIFEEFTKVRDGKGWYGHLKSEWSLQGKKVGSAQYIRVEGGKLLRKLGDFVRGGGDISLPCPKRPRPLSIK